MCTTHHHTKARQREHKNASLYSMTTRIMVYAIIFLPHRPRRRHFVMGVFHPDTHEQILTFQRPRYMLESRLNVTSSYNGQEMGEALLRSSLLLRHYDIAIDGWVLGATTDPFYQQERKFMSLSGLPLATVHLHKSLIQLQATYTI